MILRLLSSLSTKPRTGKVRFFVQYKITKKKTIMDLGPDFKEVTFREDTRSNYKHLGAMLFLPVVKNSKRFSLCHGNCGLR